MTKKRIKNATSKLSLLIALIAIIISIYSIRSSINISKSEFVSSEQLKIETLELMATMQSIIYKAAWERVGNENIDIEVEKTKIQEFMNSSTGFAYHIWISQKSREAESIGKPIEKWRSFYLDLVDIQNCDTIWNAAIISIQILELFSTMNEKDYEIIGNYLNDIPLQLSTFMTEFEKNIFFKAIRNLTINDQDEGD